jgi:hypothetical protein
LAGICFIGWTYVVAWNHIVANQAIIEQLMAQVADIRRERPVELPDRAGRSVPTAYNDAV